MDPAFSKSKFLNWIKAALALRVTKEEIEPVAYDEIVQFQQKCLKDITISNSLPPGCTCSKCNTQNVVYCHTNKICSGKPGKCKYHSNSSTQYRPSGCPNKICHNLNSDIQNIHRYHGPSYKNTDATKWCSNAWEIAKCFMPPDGYKDVTNAAETDFNGVISAFINFKGFDAKISDDLSKPCNIFDKGRDVGKSVRYCPNLEINDAELTQYFTVLNNILNDSGFKSLNKSPRDGLQKLAQLQKDEFITETDVVLNVLEVEGNSEKSKQLIDIINTNLKDIEHQGKVSIAQINETLMSSIEDIKNVTEVGKQTIEEGIQKIMKEKENAVKEIKQTMQYGNTDADTCKDRYQQSKKDFKVNLSKFYNRKRSTVPLSPLVEEIETQLAGFYVMPDMVSVKQKTPTSEQEERIPIKSLEDLFITESEDQQDIYLSADAGFGKTAFSQISCHHLGTILLSR